MLTTILVFALHILLIDAAATPHFWLYEAQTTTPSGLLPVTNITRFANFAFENLAIRSSGEILTTNTNPRPLLWQIDPLRILPPTLIYTGQNNTGLAGIAEGKPDIFYVGAGHINITSATSTVPDSYSITQIDMRNVSVLPDGNLTKQPIVKTVAKLPNAALVNGIAFASKDSDNLLVADSFRGLIWNVNVSSGAVGITLNDTTTKGNVLANNSTFTGVNGVQVHNSTMYWTVTGRNVMYKVPIQKDGTIPQGQKPVLLTSNITCDDFTLDSAGNAYVAGPLDIITKVTPDGKQKVIAGMYNVTRSDSNSTLAGPTSVKFGKLASDKWSLYITTNGGLGNPNPNGTQGVSRIDLPVLD